MSPAIHKSAVRRLRGKAPVFAALGDETRLALLTRLSGGRQLSIARLTKGARVTRQAITKHLRVLQGAGLVRALRRGRESLFEIVPQPLADAQQALGVISRQWDATLARLKSFVEV